MTMQFRSTYVRIAIALCVAIGVGVSVQLNAAEDAVIIPPPAIDTPKSQGPTQTAVFAGGCFWGVQGVFQHVRGVKNAVSGYSGGSKLTAHYGLVSMGATGHAEAVQVTFDPNEVTYGQLLQVFFSVIHDPTQLNRQGPDQGTQYRSAIFYADENQRKIARAYIDQLDKARKYSSAIVTKLDSLEGFYPAESEHQDFLVRNPRHPYIAYNDLPKVTNFRAIFPALFSAQPVLVGTAAK
jgi:peptide-methionine (S)-S-oxide reductase